MQTILMVAHLIIAILLVGVILLQRTNEDGLSGLGGGGGFGNIMSARSSAGLLSKITSVLAILFFVNCILLANLSLREANKSIVSSIVKEETSNVTKVPENE